MKKIFISIIFLCTCFLTVHAQEKNTYTFGFETQTSLYGDSGLKSMEFSADLGYNITDWFSAWIRGETSVGLLDIDHVKNYQISDVLGGVVGFNLLRIKEGSLTIKASAGGTVGGDNWKYAYYSGGVYFNFTRAKIKPTLGLGVKYYDSSSKSFDNYFRFYASFGFRFN